MDFFVGNTISIMGKLKKCTSYGNLKLDNKY